MIRRILAVGFLVVGFGLDPGLLPKAEGNASGQTLFPGETSFATLIAFDDFDPGRLGIYLPPKDSDQGGRLGGGGQRGAEDNCQNAEVILSVLAPDDSGWTSHAQPSIFWYFSGSGCTHQVKFTLSNPADMEEVINTTLSPSSESGIHRIDLTNFDVSLSPKISYIWHISLVRQERKGKKNIVSGGTLKYVPPPESLITKVSQDTGAKTMYLYARAGYWYDAFTLLSTQIAASPDDRLFRKQRICLVEQVGLSTIAQKILEEEGLDKDSGFNLSQCHTPPSGPSQN